MKMTYQKLMTKVKDGNIRIQAWICRAGVAQVQATVFVGKDYRPAVRMIEVTNMPKELI